jgi:hypothetical protein
MSTALTVPELPSLSSVPGDALVPTWSGGKLYAARVDGIASPVLSVSSFGASPTNSGAVNDIAIAAALTAALASGSELFWADEYPSATSLANLHTVRHRGPGGIVRGSDTFHVEPRRTEINRLYVSTSGSSLNDGLSASQPMQTLQDAFNVLRNYGPFLYGDWRIFLAAGAYTTPNLLHDVPSYEWVQVLGPTRGHPLVPTAILDGQSLNRLGCQTRNPAVRLWLQDVKFQNWTIGSGNGIGVFASAGASVHCVNVHTENCDFGGIIGDGAKDVNVVSGIHTNNRDHVVMNDCSGYIGRGVTSLANGPIFRGATEFSVFWSRGAQGHIDYATFETAAPIHVRIESAARVHILGSDFRRATVEAIATNTDGSYYDDEAIPNNYNDGTGDANSKRHFFGAYSGRQQNWTDVAVSEMCVYAENPGSTLTSAVKAQIGSDLVIPGPYSGALPPHYFVDKKTSIRIKVWGDLPNANASFGVDFVNAVPGVKTMGYTPFTGTPLAGGFEYEIVIAPLTETTQRSYIWSGSSTIAPRRESSACTADMGLPQTIKLMAESATGQILVRRIEVWVMG